jgi:pimeloyl-ACP methyl ester carboxylesterase
MRAIGLDRAVLVGHDLGGGVAQIVAVQHRELVRGLVLMNAIAYDSWPIPSVKAMQALGPLVERLPKGVFRLIASCSSCRAMTILPVPGRPWRRTGRIMRRMVPPRSSGRCA